MYAPPQSESLLIFHMRLSASTPTVDHVCLTIADWDRDKNVEDKVKAELKSRGLDVRSTEFRSKGMAAAEP
jgi:hypothetical protein